MRIIGTIEARMGSSRLPGKTMKPLFSGIPLLGCIIKRFQKCRLVDDIVVATTINEADDKIYNWCKDNKIHVFRGSEDNVLDRVVSSVKSFNPDAIVQMGADSAYLDYKLIDGLISIYKKGTYDYVCNDLKLTYPLGIYGHIVNYQSLSAINDISELSVYHKENVVTYIWDHPEQFKIKNIEAASNFNFPGLRLTIDYPEDFELAVQLYEHFNNFTFSTEDIIDLYNKNRSIFKKTENFLQKVVPPK